MSNPNNLLTALRNEDSLLFSVERATRQLAAASAEPDPAPAEPGSGVLPFAELAADYFAEQIRPESSSVSLLALPDYAPHLADDAGGAGGSLLLPQSAPASLPQPDRPHLMLALSLALMLLGLTTSAIATLLVIRGGPTSATAPAAAVEPLDLTAALPAAPDSVIPAEEPLPAATIPVAEPEPIHPTVTVKPKPAKKRTAPRKVASAKPAAKPAPKPAKPCADEIECLLAGVDADPAPVEPAEPEPAPDLPAKLDSYMISSAMKTAVRRAAGCGDQHGSGNVTVRLTVAPSGEVSRVVVSKTPNADLGACVATAAEKTRFPATRTGATFAYLFPYR